MNLHIEGTRWLLGSFNRIAFHVKRLQYNNTFVLYYME